MYYTVGPNVKRPTIQHLRYWALYPEIFVRYWSLKYSLDKNKRRLVSTSPTSGHMTIEVLLANEAHLLSYYMNYKARAYSADASA